MWTTCLRLHHSNRVKWLNPRRMFLLGEDLVLSGRGKLVGKRSFNLEMFRGLISKNFPSANAANGSGTLNHTPVKSEREGLNRSISQPLTPVAAVTSSSSATPQSSSTTSSNLASTASSISSSTSALSTDTEVTLRRAHSFESDER